MDQFHFFILGQLLVHFNFFVVLTPSDGIFLQPIERFEVRKDFVFRLEVAGMATSGGDMSWHFSQVKGALDDEVAEGMLLENISAFLDSSRE